MQKEGLTPPREAQPSGSGLLLCNWCIPKPIAWCVGWMCRDRRERREAYGLMDWMCFWLGCDPSKAPLCWPRWGLPYVCCKKITLSKSSQISTSRRDKVGKFGEKLIQPIQAAVKKKIVTLIIFLYLQWFALSQSALSTPRILFYEMKSGFSNIDCRGQGEQDCLFLCCNCITVHVCRRSCLL